MSRAKWKGPFINIKHLNEVTLESKTFDNKQKKTPLISRDSEIVPAFIGLTFNVYNGKTYSEITVIENMVGYKFGEFSFTRSRFLFKKNKQRK